ncbi:DUF2333 family protein [Gilvimarinus agarilyticus]|uniref:DUF2333 family protein n=1 Tax=Gilvimarinus sp. 2_MG-2023 TaxID=3062666 RepID=UPI001C092742|nr:DUF2333 family protein [Gilvimarinus sp. 2_MG-2023]MBU2885656.1 DUF2333 family protein [Gilvimarinus agarilyticus]MDO6570515.1 DUF2333 family protein [Gilvimarinus sp. 2_MG-2023]
MALEKIKQGWHNITHREKSQAYNDNGDSESTARWGWLLIPIVLLGLALVVLGCYWSFTPTLFNVSARTEAALVEYERKSVVGAATTVSLITVADTLLNKPGGYLSNDVTPPSLWLDNMPHWEYGVIIQVRDMSKAMREAFSRSQSQSLEDENLATAESRFNFNNDSWLFPATEKQYREGITHLNRYLQRLADPADKNAQFFARADNLRYWLSTVETRLGNLSQRLSASVGQQRINTDLAGDSVASQATPAPGDDFVKTPWLEIDDIYFEARGSAWALIHFLRAVEHDFADVLEKKNALVSLRQIIRELEATQYRIHSPMILNGSGFGLWANHSLVMASYISRANAAIIDLRELLAQG